MSPLLTRDTSRMILAAAVILGMLMVLAIPQNPPHGLPTFTSPIPEGALIRLGKGGIQTMALSPDGTDLAVSTSVGVFLYDGLTLRLRWVSAEARLSVLAFSPNGSALVGLAPPSPRGSHGGRAVVWDVRTGTILRTLDTGGSAVTWRGERMALPHVQQGEDVNGRYQPEWGIELLDLTTGQTLHNLSLSRGDILDEIAFSPSGAEMAVTTHRSSVLIWDTAAGEMLREIPFPGGYPLGLTYSPDGSILAIQTFYAAFLMDPVSGAMLYELRPPEGGIQSLGFSPDGKSIAAGLLDETLFIWNLATGEHQSWPLSSIAREFAWSPGGNWLYVGSDDSQITVWDLKAATPVRALESHFPLYGDTAWSPDSQQVAAVARGSKEQSLLLIWDLAGNLLQRLEYSGQIGPVAWSPDGSTLALWKQDGTLLLLDTLSWSPQRTVQFDDSSFAGDITWSPGGRVLALAVGDRKVILYDVSQDQIVQTFSVLPEWHPSPEFSINPVICLDWSPDGTRLAAGLRDGPGYVWDIASAALLTELEHYRTAYPYMNSVIDLSWSLDGTRLAGGFNYEGRFARDVNGRIIMLPSDAVAIWDAQTGEQIASLQTHRPFVLSLDGSPTDSRIAFSLFDRGIRMWDGNDTLLLVEDLLWLGEESNDVYELAWSPDGTMLASLGADGTIIVWDMAP